MKRHTYTIAVNGKELSQSQIYKFFGDYFNEVSSLEHAEKLLNYHYARFGGWMEDFEIIRHTYDVVDVRVFKMGSFDTTFIKERRIRKMVE